MSLIMDNMVSVIIPTYKNRGGLSQSVESALSQDGVDVEIIVVDDNDPDSEWRFKTESEMKKYENKSNVIYIKHDKNKNGAAARNTGIKASSGEYIAFLDDDDIFLPHKLIRQIEYLSNHPNYAGVYGQLIRNGKVVSFGVPEGDLSKDLLLLRAHLQTSTLLIKKDAVIKIGGFDETFYRHQDYEFLLKYFQSGFKIGAIPYPVTVFGKNNGENIPSGEKLENIKTIYLSSFERYISKIDNDSPGFKKKVFATQFSGVFLRYIKSLDVINAMKILLKYSFYAPSYFWRPVVKSLFAHVFSKSSL